MKTLWEILVPATNNSGEVIPIEVHRQWDEKIREISGGLTIFPPTKGQWLYEGQFFAERMIPVRFLATLEEAKEAIDLTISFYEQKAVMAYEISNHVLLVQR